MEYDLVMVIDCYTVALYLFCNRYECSMEILQRLLTLTEILILMMSLGFLFHAANGESIKYADPQLDFTAPDFNCM